jgi:hypothetical protein
MTDTADATLIGRRGRRASGDWPTARPMSAAPSKRRLSCWLGDDDRMAGEFVSNFSATLAAERA